MQHFFRSSTSYKITRCHNAEDHILNTHHHEKLCLKTFRFCAICAIVKLNCFQQGAKTILMYRYISVKEEGACDQLIQRWVNPHLLEQTGTQYCAHVSNTGYFQVSLYLFKYVLPAKTSYVHSILRFY
jgi:hypothetical protein